MNKHKEAYRLACHHLRRMRRIKAIFSDSERDKADTHDMLDGLIALGESDLQTSFGLGTVSYSKQWRAAELTLKPDSEPWPRKYEQPFWFRKFLLRSESGNSLSGWKVRYIRRPDSKQIYDEIPF
ncbi:MAG TPA: hypothetical protein PLQ56_27710 [Aggregatilineales bacterium]|nr:hypothetical protein [Aggregatilineales bacterium]